MALSEELRNELAQIAPDRRCCRFAEVSALFHVSGAWHLQGGTVAVHDAPGGGASFVVTLRASTEASRIHSDVRPNESDGFAAATPREQSL